MNASEMIKLQSRGIHFILFIEDFASELVNIIQACPKFGHCKTYEAVTPDLKKSIVNEFIPG